MTGVRALGAAGLLGRPVTLVYHDDQSNPAFPAAF